MNIIDLLDIRLYNQQLTVNHFNNPEEIVSWMGAMQAQNYEMAKWGIGVRLKDAKNSEIEKAINTGKIIRTHILRPTWHFVNTQDIHWMLDLTAARLKKAFFTYAKTRGFDESIIPKSLHLINKLLGEKDNLTRQEIGDFLKLHKVPIEDCHHIAYIMTHAELEGIVCSGKVEGNKQTYSSLHQKAPKKLVLSKEEALERLARKFFTSHGPATLQDYIWWSGLRSSEAREGLEFIKDDFISEIINGKEYWMKNDIKVPKAHEPSYFLLPAFDEYIVSYKDRSEILSESHYRKIITRTGIFSPIITVNGVIMGSWKRVNKKKATTAELSFFNETDKLLMERFSKKLEQYRSFYNN